MGPLQFLNIMKDLCFLTPIYVANRGLNVCNGQPHDFSRLCQDYELFNPNQDIQFEIFGSINIWSGCLHKMIIQTFIPMSLLKGIL